MAGGRPVVIDPAREPQLAAGIDCHHRTDAVFHRLAAFRRWSRDLTARLGRAGVGRGPAMGAGHVGVELLLDGVLVEREPAVAGIYGEALGEVATIRGASPAMKHLAAELLRRGLPVGYCDPQVVADRVVRVLSRRPRLAMSAAAESVLAAELTWARPAIAAGAAELLEELERQLA